MSGKRVLNYLEKVIENMPSDWLKLTTHRLDIYNEELAKTQFTEQFETLYEAEKADADLLSQIPTAYDYIRLGHPLSCVLEWGVAQLNDLRAENVISFSSKTMPVLAIMRTNGFADKHTQVFYSGELPDCFDVEILQKVYGYQFEVKKVNNINDVPQLKDSTIFISQDADLADLNPPSTVDFLVSIADQLGSVLVINDDQAEHYVSEIQHVRRRETVAMTPDDCFTALKLLTGKQAAVTERKNQAKDRASVVESIHKITGTTSNAQIANCGLSMQYAIMMGLVNYAAENHPGKAIKFIVPPNCYGGTNDQARRVAAAIDNAAVMDLPVDGKNDMVNSIDRVLDEVAKIDAIPYIIAEIPTNPRVEVPDLVQLKAVLSKTRKTPHGVYSIAPVFILDQTFCPNVQFLGSEGILSSVKTISYVSGSKFPSGGKCTAGYGVANEEAEEMMANVEKHLLLCDNQATGLQLEILAEQLPSMNQRIKDAYINTREFVNYIEATLPDAKINFVSEELAAADFTPSVFSLDLPTKGDTAEAREAYKRELNHKLINLMINEIPNESKYCVSYGQLKGCYWTIPATSTQGTTKEGDKDYIARVSVSPDIDLEKHKQVFSDFVAQINS
ncbi:MAG: cystathionine beta-synthase [Vicingaceae bacterium]